MAILLVILFLIALQAFAKPMVQFGRLVREIAQEEAHLFSGDCNTLTTGLLLS